jgi:hypothetical protein
MADSTPDQRDFLLARLEQDLIGPSDGPEETINERPTDRYLTGILYPQRTEGGQEAEETLGSGGIGEGDETAFEQVAMSRMTRPATAGISFAATGKAIRLRFEIHCGTYEEIENTDQTLEAPVDPISTERASGADVMVTPAKTLPAQSKWRRIPHEISVVLDPQSVATLDLTSLGAAGLELTLQQSAYESGVLVTAVLVNRNTVGKGESRVAADSKSFFQVGMRIEPSEGTRLPARPSRRAALDQDGLSAALLYRDALEFAVGHTCSADWQIASDNSSASSIATTWLPTAAVAATSSVGGKPFVELAASEQGRCFDADVLAGSDDKLSGLLESVPAAYEKWIQEQDQRATKLPQSLRAQALEHLKACRACLTRMRGGVALIKENQPARTAFRLANMAMSLQFNWTQKENKKLRWRPFQLAFLLLTIESVANHHQSDRDVMDLLWFPTGGGKTEAYLGLAAFTLFLRRLRHPNTPDIGAGTGALMRYTLRLLTTQQFQRAAALVLACEHLRRTEVAGPGALGSVPYSIGLWVGRDAVANSVSDALKALEDDKPNRPDQLSNCPACGARLLWGPGLRRTYVKVVCTNDACVMGSEDLPIWTVDEDVYDRVPSLVIGTVDKFAQLPRKLEAGKLFGLGTPYDAIDLIIQDELHLISGPLGTLAGLYEAAIDELCVRDGVRPKVIGSTATIRRASEQIMAIFNREAELFPPPGLDASDSGFAVRDSSAPARRYSSVTTAGRSAKFTLQAVSASLLQSAKELFDRDLTPDAYWTLVEYFNALRELGGALVLMQDDVPSTIEQFAQRHNEAPRTLQIVAELTSRLSQFELKDRLDELKQEAGSGTAIDVLLATNMISVGIDISRLGLMIMNGQPKAVAEYIQATSRVGRANAPGLIVSIYNNAKARDRSRFETFRTWHETLYREVEATSVTPFSSRARDRALHAALVTLARHLVPGLHDKPVLGTSEEAVRGLADRIVARASVVEAEEQDATRVQLDDLLEQWVERTHLDFYFNDWKPANALMVSAERAATMRAARREIGDAWPTPSSMRSVEPMTKVALIEHLRAETDDEDEDE